MERCVPTVGECICRRLSLKKNGCAQAVKQATTRRPPPLPPPPSPSCTRIEGGGAFLFSKLVQYLRRRLRFSAPEADRAAREASAARWAAGFIGLPLIIAARASPAPYRTRRLRPSDENAAKFNAAAHACSWTHSDSWVVQLLASLLGRPFPGSSSPWRTW